MFITQAATNVVIDVNALITTNVFSDVDALAVIDDIFATNVVIDVDHLAAIDVDALPVI